MAEQISLEKTQLELELAQVKQQLERQQDRIKGIGNTFTSCLQENKIYLEGLRFENLA